MIKFLNQQYNSGQLLNPLIRSSFAQELLLNLGLNTNLQLVLTVGMY